MERSNIRKITSWYGKYLSMFHRLVMDVLWWFADFPSSSTVCFFSHFGYTPPFFEGQCFCSQTWRSVAGPRRFGTTVLLRFFMNPEVVWTGSILSAGDCYLPNVEGFTSIAWYTLPETNSSPVVSNKNLLSRDLSFKDLLSRVYSQGLLGSGVYLK